MYWHYLPSLAFRPLPNKRQHCRPLQFRCEAAADLPEGMLSETHLYLDWISKIISI